jgi:DNA-directed RNA polymerase specialized sigma subunit
MVQKRPNDRSSHISSLRERDRQIVTLYHQVGLTMRQLAELMSVDESRIS